MVKHDVALWAGLSAFFANLAAIAAVDIIGSDTPAKVVAVAITSLIVGATVYCKQRLDDAKASRADG